MYCAHPPGLFSVVAAPARRSTRHCNRRPLKPVSAPGNSAAGRSGSRRAIGAAGEDAALAWLRERGLQPVARNVSFAFGEIDLIMRDGATVVFVEVRQRRRDRFGGAAAPVADRKSVVSGKSVSVRVDLGGRRL